MRFLWLLLLLFVGPVAYAQDSDLPEFDLLSMDQGLPVYVITGITQDSLGYLWVGTVAGLSRYDGYEFKTYRHQPGDTTSLAHDYVSSTNMAIDRQGYLWVGTRGGLSRFDPRTEVFQAMGPVKGTITSVLLSKSGEIWASSSEGIMRFERDGQLKEIYNSLTARVDHAYADTVVNLIEGPKGYLWAATMNGVRRIDPESGEQTPYYFEVPESAWSLYFDKDGMLWAGSFNGNTHRLNPETQQMKRIEVPLARSEEGASNMVMAFYEDDGGRLWAGTYGYGVYWFDSASEVWVHSREMTEIVGKQITSSYTDRTGKLWVGTGAGLKHKRHKKAFSQLGGSSSPLQGVASVRVADNKDIWVGTRGQGLIRFNAEGQIIQQFTTENGDLLSDQVAAIIEDAEGMIWLGTAGAGVARISPSGSVTPYIYDPNDPTSLGDNLVYTIFEDQDQRIWISTARGGLNLWDRSTESFVRYKPGGEGSISSREVWSMFQDAKGTLWVGTQEGGLNKLHIEDTGEFPPDITFESFQANPESSGSLSSNNVVAINESIPGQLVLGTMGGGVNVMDVEEQSFTSFSVDEGVPNVNVGCILFDKTGRKWLSTSSGLAYYNAADSSFTTFSVLDGLQSSAFNFNGCDVDDEGRFYMANEAGVTVFDPEEIELNTVPPKVVITDVYLFNEPFMPDTSASYKRRLVLPYDQNFLSFRFAALDYNITEKNAYLYKMEGIDENWVRNLDGRIANYPNLSPGNYTFRVRGTNNDGIWSEEDTVMHIHITRPYWAQWWFISLLSAIVLGFGYWLYDARAKQRKREADMRQQIADDLHDDLGSNLGALSYFLDRMLQRNTLKPEDEETAQMYVSSVQKMIGDLDDVVWLADSGFDHLGSLVGRMQLAARILVSEKELAFKVGDFSEDLPIPMEIRRHLFLAFKEAVHNAVQHSEGTSIKIDVTQEASVIRISIQDDGKGFIRDELEEEGKGLDSLDRRGTHPRLSFIIDSQPGMGTTVILEADMT